MGKQALVDERPASFTHVQRCIISATQQRVKARRARRTGGLIEGRGSTPISPHPMHLAISHHHDHKPLTALSQSGRRGRREGGRS